MQGFYNLPFFDNEYEYVSHAFKKMCITLKWAKKMLTVLS